jgi:hypothetical protein
MAQWILVFAPNEVNLDALADRLSADADVERVEETILDVVRSTEHVQIFIEDTAETLVEHENAGYDPQETVRMVAQLPNPTVLRICYYRGTDLLHTVLRALCEVMGPCFVDNDHGVVERLDLVLEEQGLSAFLTSRRPLVE